MSRMTAVISTHDGRAKVIDTLHHLTVQAPPEGGLDVVVIADGCTDGTASAIAERSWPAPVRVVEQPQGGLAAARNRGAGETTSSVILFMDDDMQLRPGFLRAVDRCIRQGADIVIPTVLSHEDGHGLLAQEIRGWMRSEASVLASGGMSYDLVHFQAGAMRRSVHEQMGGFDERYTAGGRYGNEDIEFGHRVLSAGAQVRHCPDAVAMSSEVDTVDRALRRTRQLAPNDVLMVTEHPSLVGPVLGRKLHHSRINRLLARGVVVRGPWLAVLADLTAPLARRVVPGSAGGLLAHRLWFVARAATYWDGIRRAGGADIVREVLGAPDDWPA